MDYLFDGYDTSQPARFKQERFAKWLREHPNDKLICGNPRSCAVAQWVADEMTPEGAASVTVDDVVTFYDEHSQPIAGFYLPDWALDFIEVFDEGSNKLEWTPDGYIDTAVPTIRRGNGQESHRTGAESISVLNHVTGRRFKAPKAA